MSPLKILVFTEGTAIMHMSAIGVSREKRVQQSVTGGQDITDFRHYVPNGLVVEKLSRWKAQGADIYYLTSRTTEKEVEDIRFVLSQYDFPDVHRLVFRKGTRAYKDVAGNLLPDVLIEDDCESIGGSVEMTYPHIHPLLQKKIHSIVVKEFEGIDHLPDDLEQLRVYKK